MKDMLNASIENILNENSPFIKDLLQSLTQIGIDIDAKELTTIINEYETVKFDFFKEHLTQLIDSGILSPDNPTNGPVKVVVSKAGNPTKPKRSDKNNIDTNYIC